MLCKQGFNVNNVGQKITSIRHEKNLGLKLFEAKKKNYTCVITLRTFNVIIPILPQISSFTEK